jgi:hypothetical protein
MENTNEGVQVDVRTSAGELAGWWWFRVDDEEVVCLIVRDGSGGLWVQHDGESYKLSAFRGILLESVGRDVRRKVIDECISVLQERLRTCSAREEEREGELRGWQQAVYALCEEVKP